MIEVIDTIGQGLKRDSGFVVWEEFEDAGDQKRDCCLC